LKIGPPNWQTIDDIFFRRWRDLFGSERAVEHLEDTLRSRPSWHVSASGKVTRVDPGFWPRAKLSEEINAEGVDCLAVRYTPYVHDPDYSQYDGRFFLRTVDIIGYEERFASGNNVTLDYSPIEEFEREIAGRPRTSPRLYLTTAAPPPAVVEQDAPARKPRPPTASKKPKETLETRLVSIMKDIGLKKSGLLPREVLKAVKQPYKDKYRDEPSQSAATRAYDQYKSAD
jgi:hypothetical protein